MYETIEKNSIGPRRIHFADPDIISAREAFSEGVNQYITKYPLPPEFKILGYKPEPWEPIHSLNLIGYMAWDLTEEWSTELLFH